MEHTLHEEPDITQCVYCNMSYALLGEITPNVRAVTVAVNGNTVHFTCFYDSKPSADNVESMAVVETELIARLPETYSVSHDVTRVDFPEVISAQGRWVYSRREPAGKLDRVGRSFADQWEMKKRWFSRIWHSKRKRQA